MTGRAIVVVDVGKTAAKVTLVDAGGHVLARRERANAVVEVEGVRRLDANGIEGWLRGALAELPCRDTIGWIVPVAHGAAAALVDARGLRALPLDYEQPLPDSPAYDRQRDGFAATGSPRLANGLNLGAQLDFLEVCRPGFGDGTAIVPWPQYWAYRLSGVMAAEVSSLGCHSDLWRPLEARTSDLCRVRGWGDRLPPIRRADAVLGPLLPEWVEATGLPAATQVLCGVHDSNAALLAARGFAEIAGREATMLSTGTWFVAMRSPAPGAAPDLADLPAGRDCLVNVDVEGRAIPSARFMGGRELQLLGEDDGPAIDDARLQQPLLDMAEAVVGAGAMILPSAVPGSGPFARGSAQWIARPADAIARGTAAALYAALVTDAMLDLIGASERLVIEGRFSRARLFTRALAALRPEMAVFVAPDGLDLAYGACRLVRADVPPPGGLVRVVPLPLDLEPYRQRWRILADDAN